jgi:hypothetical protein
MNREDTRKAVEVMLHYADGGEVQIKAETSEDDWQDLRHDTPGWDWISSDYRIRPEPREYWVDVTHLAVYLPKDVVESSPPDKWIKVREVLE